MDRPRVGLTWGVAAGFKAENRCGRFAQHVADQFSAGRRFLDDLPHEVVVDDAELDAIADKSTSSPDKSDNSQGEYEAGNDRAETRDPNRGWRDPRKPLTASVRRSWAPAPRLG